MKQNIQILVIVLIICFSLAHIMSINVYNKNEYFKNKSHNSNTQTNCDCYDNINNKDKIYTPVAVNIPVDNTEFNTLHNIIDDTKMKIKGKYCFPIEKYTYDGVWNNNRKDINKIPNKQTNEWNLKNIKPIDDIYCANKFLILPEKNLKPGDVVCQKGNCNEFNPSVYQVSERLQDKCKQNNLFIDIMKTTYNYYTINGL